MTDAGIEKPESGAETQPIPDDEALNPSAQAESGAEPEAQADLTPKAKSNKKENKKEKANKPIVLLKCTVCSKEFESRNKLYQHITSEGHTANKLVVEAATAAAALDAGLDPDGQPLSHNAIKKNKRLAKLAGKK